MKRYSDIPGDGGSKILEQVLRQQEKIRTNLSSIRHLIAIASGKGGVGKSTLTIQLGASLCSFGKKVSLLDLDFNGPSLAKFAGLENALLLPGENGLGVPKTREGLGVLSFGTILGEGQALDFPSVSSGESYVWRGAKEFTTLGEILGSTDWGDLDFLLLDLPPGAERTFQFAEFLGSRASFILVTIPSAVSRSVVKRTLDALQKLPNRILGYIENMQGYYCYGCKEIRPLFPSNQSITLPFPCLGSVPFDPALAKLCDQGEPLLSCAELHSGENIKFISKALLEHLVTTQ